MVYYANKSLLCQSWTVQEFLLNLQIIGAPSGAAAAASIWLPGTDYSALRASPFAGAQGRPAGDRRRCAASSNRLVVCRRFELAAGTKLTRLARLNLLKLAPRDGFEPPTNGLTVRRSTTELPGNAEEARDCLEAGPRSQGIGGALNRCRAFDFGGSPMRSLARGGPIRCGAPPWPSVWTPESAWYLNRYISYACSDNTM